MRSTAVLVVCLLALGSAVTPVAAQDDPAGDVTIDVYVQADGDAHWTVSTRFALDSEADREAFRRLADKIVNGSDPPGFDAEVLREFARQADERVARSVAITDVTRSARTTQNGTVGVVSLDAQWENFTRTADGTMLIGDVFPAWRLSADQTLRLHLPQDYGLTGVEPDPSGFGDGTLTWSGERQFDAGEPALQLARSAAPTTTQTDTVTDTATRTETTVGPATGGGLDVGFVATLVAAVLLGGGSAYVVTRRDALLGGDQSDDDPDDGASGATAADPPEEDAVDPELLSDEERVERLVASNGGRMKQADIVTETGWSNAKVSQLLSAMDEDGRVEKLRIGRENLISLPDHDAEDAE